jgi:hypothetical protein
MHDACYQITPNNHVPLPLFSTPTFHYPIASRLFNIFSRSRIYTASEICGQILSSCGRSITKLVVGYSFPNKQKVFHVRKHLALPSRGIRSFLSTKLSNEVLGHPFCIRSSWILLKVSLLSSLASSASSSFISSIFESSPAPVAFKFTSFYSNHFNCLLSFDLSHHPHSRCNTHPSSLLRPLLPPMSSPTVSSTQSLVPTV